MLIGAAADREAIANVGARRHDGGVEHPPAAYAFDRLSADGRVERVMRPIADETPVAIEVNGIGYAVLMATAADLIDLAHGFAQAERLGRVIDVDQHRAATGAIVRLTVEEAADSPARRVRNRASDSACGLCGLENLEQVMRPLPRVTAGSMASDAAIFAALAALGERQPLGQATGAAHAAALCDAAGSIRLVREDVGRHNAFDKLIGAMLQDGLAWDGGFALLSSRCSYELVEKAVLADCPLLVTISAPTSLALDRAAEAGLALVVLARPDSVLRA